MPVRTIFRAFGFSGSQASRSGTVVAGARTIAPVDCSMNTWNRILRSPKRARSCLMARAKVTRSLLSAVVSPMPWSSFSLIVMGVDLWVGLSHLPTSVNHNLPRHSVRPSRRRTGSVRLPDEDERGALNDRSARADERAVDVLDLALPGVALSYDGDHESVL